MDDQVRMHALQERNHQLGGISAARGKNEQSDADNRAHKDLQQKFAFAGESEIALLRDLRVIIDKSDGRERQQREQRQQHESIG